MSLLEEIKLGKPIPTNEDYKKNLQKMEFWDESVEVDEDYYETLDPNGNAVLKKFVCEEKEDFKFRKSVSSPRNYMQGILGKYISTIFKYSPEREEAEFYTNVDLLGSTMDEFMSHKTYEAAVYGASYMMPDTTVTDPNLSEAQKRQIGARPFIRSIETENVVNWVDYLGHLQEVIVVFDGPDGNQFAVYYDNENMLRVELDAKGRVSQMGEVVPHGYSFMPVVRILPINTEESFVAPGSLTQMTINNLLSLEKTELFSSTFTRYFLKGVRVDQDDDQTKKIIWGNNRLISTDSTDAAITPLGADVAQAQSIRDSIKQEEEALYKQYHLSATQVGDATQTPSGFALVVSKAEFNSICLQFVKAIERAETQLVALLNESESMNLTPAVYSKNFLEMSKQEKILEMRDVISLPIPKLIKDKEIKSFAKSFYNLEDGEMEQIDRELAVRE
jgi:hypothetical protein